LVADALEGRAGYERLHDLLRYAADRLETESIEDPTWNTFECVVDGQQAFRPEVASMIAGAASP